MKSENFEKNVVIHIAVFYQISTDTYHIMIMKSQLLRLVKKPDAVMYCFCNIALSKVRYYRKSIV